MSDDPVDLARYADASSARDAARRLLAAGLPADVRRDGAEHVLAVPRIAAGPAAEALAIDLAGVLPDGDDGGHDDEPEGQPAGNALSSPDPSSPDLAATGGPATDLAPSAPGPPGPRVVARPEDEEVPLGELLVDERGFVVVAVADDPPAARTMAAELLEHGIGSELVSAFDTGHANPMVTRGAPEAVQVLEIDMDRALDVLGREQVPERLQAPPAPRIPPAPQIPPELETAPSEVGLVISAPSAPPRLRKRTESEELVPYFGGRVRLTRRQMRTMIALYLAALVLIPLTFFYLTRWLLTPEVETPEIPTQEDFPALHIEL